MKESIIKQMTQIVRDVMTSFTDDFYKYDMADLQDYDGRFVWVVGSSHTNLAKIGEEYLNKMLESEIALYHLLQGDMTIDAVLYLKYKGDLVFYYDGENLVRIAWDEAERIWGAVRDWALFTWQVKNKKELPSNFKIPVHLCNCRERIKRLLQSERASNLMDELKRRRNGIKANHTDCVNIYVEGDDSLYFERVYVDDNGERRCSLNGGIIYYSGCWHTHT